jgi:hypothetical protein
MLWGIPGEMSAATILSRDRSLDAIIPKEAYDGVGVWTTGDYYVATGHAVADSLGETKGKRTERDLGEAEARMRIISQAAAAKEPSFDPDSFEVEADVTGFRTAATYRLDGRDGIFLIGLVKRRDAHVQLVFNPQKAREKAFRLFEAGQFREAAAQFALLTQRGVQDQETATFAHAAGWHVNLLGGVSGSARAEALRGLGEFYYGREEYEASLKWLYDLYRDTEKPDRKLLMTLIDLSEKTHREKAIDGFKKELHERFPSADN